MPLVSPPALLQAYLSQAPPTRPSGRTSTQTRPINLNTGSLTHCNGSSLVKLGESTIVCGIRAELLPVSEIPHYRASENARTAPEEDEDKDYEAITLNNLLVPNLELSTNCHPSFPPNAPPSTTAQGISQRVLSLLHSSRLVRVTDLEIRYSAPAGELDVDTEDPAYVEPERDVLKAYWVLYIDCVALGCGGECNAFDAVVLGVVAALRDLRLPKARWDEDVKGVFCDAEWERGRVLRLRGLPCPLGFGVFEPDSRLGVGGQVGQVNGAAKETKMEAVTLMDIDAFEDDVCEEKGNVVVDCSTGTCRILRIEKAGGSGRLDVSGMREVVEHAEKRWHDWKRVLDTATGGAG